MKHLWSPWRMAYIQRSKPDGCAFCTVLAQPDGPENLIVVRAQHTFVILNRFPYTSGHLMVVPYEHYPTLEKLDSPTRSEMMELTNLSIQVLRDEYQPQGFNLGMNIGEVAGAGITEHVHMHIVPRWGGDTNFMSSLAETRVLPESLEETFRRLKTAWEQTEKT